MKKIVLLLFICLFAYSTTTAKKKAKRVIIIALDGISVSALKKANTPNLDALIHDGALSMNTRIVRPSVTLPNWTSHLTGSYPEQHGVIDNSWKIDKIKLPAQITDNEGYYPSIFETVKGALPESKTAFYYNWINLFYPYNKKHFDEVVYLKNDEYVPYYNQAFDFILKHKNDPTLVFLYSVHTDHAGHKHKWMSEPYIESIEEADIQIGIFLDKLKEEGLYKGTHFMFLSDHGGVNHGHGGVSLDEMLVPWAITGPGIKKNFIIEEPNNTVNTAATILHLFKIKQKPLSWIGEVPHSIFK